MDNTGKIARYEFPERESARVMRLLRGYSKKMPVARNYEGLEEKLADSEADAGFMLPHGDMVGKVVMYGSLDRSQGSVHSGLFKQYVENDGAWVGRSSPPIQMRYLVD